jgi:ribosomal protein L16 Arg81 hydroxylase
MGLQKKNYAADFFSSQEIRNRFSRHFKNKRLLYEPNGWESLAKQFSYGSLERLLTSFAFKRVQVVKDGNANDCDPFLTPDGYGKVSQTFSYERFKELANSKTSFRFRGLEEVDPSVEICSHALEKKLGVRVWVNGYLSIGQHIGLKAHHDEHDALICQVDGQKKWNFPHINEGKGGHFVLNPGDLLYVPKGVIHAPKIVGKYSLHLTFALLEPSLPHFIDWASKRRFRSGVQVDRPLHSLEDLKAAFNSNVQEEMWQRYLSIFSARAEKPFEQLLRNFDEPKKKKRKRHLKIVKK